MKRFLLVLLVLLAIGFVVLQFVRGKVREDLAQPVRDLVIPPSPTVMIDRIGKTKTSLFVPYWTVDEIETGNYETYVYFGLTPSKKGIDATETGAQRITDFLEHVPPGKTKLLTLRMIDQDTNSAILKDKKLQQTIISQTVATAKEYGFSGVVLDLEVSALPFDALVTQISDFTHDLAIQTKGQNLQFDMTVYGDTFYRVRPFDVKKIAKDADNVMLMAYDFHKSRSNPGPNFPLSGKSTYGYDIGAMADEFLQVVPNQKLTVIFGLFGYDWPVDTNGKAIGQGSPLTDVQIKAKFIDSCDYSACTVRRDNVSGETEIRYTDEEGQKHVVWFEDMQSVSAKQKLLKQKGIENFSFWANSYF